MEGKDPYKVLGVSPSASTAEVKAAFRNLAKQHHPDLNRGEKGASAEARFKLVLEAYEVLGYEDRRRAHDAERRGAGPAHVPGDGVDQATAARWAREAGGRADAWGPRYTHTGRAAPGEWQTFDFEEWNRMHYGPSAGEAGEAARHAAHRFTRQARRGRADEPRAADGRAHADRARAETDFYWRRLHRLRQARRLSRWGVPLQLAAFAGVGVAVWAGTRALLPGPGRG